MSADLIYLDSIKQMPLLALPVRTPVVALASARVMISPGSKLTPYQLQQAGDVTDLVASNLFHTAGMHAAAAAFPQARLWGPVGVQKKHPELRWHGTLGVDPWPYESELALVTLEGMDRMREAVFVHHASRSLFVTDLLFNMVDARGVGAWIILKLFDTHQRLGVSKFILRLTRDRAALRASLARVVALDFDRLVPSHGDIVETDGKARLLAALRERGLA